MRLIRPYNYCPNCGCEMEQTGGDDDVHFWKCRTYVESDQVKRIEMFFKKIARLKSGADMRGEEHETD